MRLLLVPIFNFPGNLNADSIHTITEDWAIKLLEAMPTLAIHRVLPHCESDNPFKVWGTYKVRHHPRLHNHLSNQFSRYDLEEANLDSDFWQQWHPALGRLPAHAVLSTSGIRTMLLKRFFQATAGPARTPEFFNLELLIRGGDSSQEVSAFTDEEQYLQAGGEVFARNLWQSPKCRNMALSSARKILPPSAIDKIMKTEHMVYSGYPSDEAYPLPLKDRFERFTLIVRGRITPSKNVDKILGLYNMVRSTGRDVDVIVTTGTSMQIDRLPILAGLAQANNNIRLVYARAKSEANELMRRSHAFCLWSSHELFCVSLWEMLGAGLLGPIKRADWHKGLLPDAYPYVFDTKEEAFEMLTDIHDNYEQRLEELSWVKDEVKRKFSFKNTTENVARIISSVAASPGSDWMADIYRASGRPSFTNGEAFDYMVQHSEQGRTLLAEHRMMRLQTAMGGRDVYDALIAAGYRDEPESRVPTFVRCE